MRILVLTEGNVCWTKHVISPKGPGTDVIRTQPITKRVAVIDSLLPIFSHAYWLRPRGEVPFYGRGFRRKEM